jgi:gas vesicle protein
MNQQPTPALLALLGGAALGAIAMALTTPKTGREVRAVLGGLNRRLRRQATEELDDGEVLALFI